MLQTIGLLAGATMSLLGTPTTNSTSTEITKSDPEPYYRFSQTEDQWQGSFVSMYSNSTLTLPGKPADELKPSEATASSKVAIKAGDTKSLEPVNIHLPSQRIQITNISTNQSIDSGSNGLSAEELFNLVNAYRNQLDLPGFIEHPQICELAQSRAPELHDEIFNGKGMHSGLRQRNIDYHVTENMIHQRTESAALNWWLNSPIHRRALESTNNTYGCVACQGNSCAFLFTSFVAKK